MLSPALPRASFKTSARNATDEELLARVAARDEQALANLYERYRSFAFAVAMRVVSDPGRAEDVVQDAFLSVWRRAGTYSSARGSARTWLASVVRNRAIDLVRAGREHGVEDPEPALLALHDSAPAVHDQVAASLDGVETRRALGELPDEQRQAIALAYYGGLSHSEIADRTGLPLGTVKSRVRLGLLRMRQSLAPLAA